MIRTLRAKLVWAVALAAGLAAGTMAVAQTSTQLPEMLSRDLGPVPGQGVSGQLLVDPVSHQVWQNKNGIWVSLGELRTPIGANINLPIASPRDIAGLQLDLDAGRGTYSDNGCSTPAVNGGALACWTDNSGHGRTATQPASGNRPTWAASQVNGLPSVHFTKSNAQYLLSSYKGEVSTVFIVYKHSGVKSFVGFMGAQQSNHAPAAPAYMIDAGTGVKPYFTNFLRSVTTDSAGFSIIAGTSYVVGIWDVYAVNFTGANAIAGHGGVLYPARQGTLPAGKTLTAIDPAGTAVIGADIWGNSVTDHFDGDIARLLVYSPALSSDDFNRVSQYLRAKYATPSYSGQYLWAAFQAPDSSANESLAMFQSDDGITWSYRPSSYLPPSGSTLRDPSIIYHQGLYWIAYTISGTGHRHVFALAVSADGYNFSFVADVDCSDAVGIGAGAAIWAPEWFLDDDQTLHIVYSGSSDATAGGFQLYEKHLTAPLAVGGGTWSASVRITGTGLPSYMIDGFVWKVGPTYWIIYKNTISGYMDIMTSSTLTSGYTITRPNVCRWGGGYEGPTVIPLGNGSYRALLDHAPSGRYNYQYSDTSDNFATCTAPTDISAPGTAKIEHGTVIRAP